MATLPSREINGSGRRSRRAAAFLLAALALPACRTVDYTPRVIPITEVQIAPYANPAALALRNTATAGRILIAEHGATTVNGDRHHWTRVALELASSELSKRGVQVGDTGLDGKTVDLAISRVRIDFEFVVIRCVVQLHVALGDGRTIVIEGDNSSPATIYRAIDGALSRAVAGLLDDPRFRAYLEGT